MPYIDPSKRLPLDELIDPLAERLGELYGPGELNYAITRLIRIYSLCLSSEPNYAQLNSIVGVLENAKHEFQRTELDPYEDRKRDKNGDIFDHEPTVITKQYTVNGELRTVAIGETAGPVAGQVGGSDGGGA